MTNMMWRAAASAIAVLAVALSGSPVPAQQNSEIAAIALLSLIWFELGNGSLVFVLVHSVLRPVALNTRSGFKSVSNTLRMVNRNHGLRGLPYIARIPIPAAKWGTQS